MALKDTIRVLLATIGKYLTPIGKPFDHDSTDFMAVTVVLVINTISRRYND